MSFTENFDRKKLQHILLFAMAAVVVAILVLLLIVFISTVSDNVSGASNFELEGYTVTDKDISSGPLILADEDHPFQAGNELVSTMVNCQEYRNANRQGDNGPYYTMNAVQLSQIAMVAAHNLLTDAESAVQQDDLLIKYAYFATDGSTAEYNTGMLMYLTNYEEHELSAEYKSWVDENAVNYGFVKSFEYGYRYVGLPHAKYMTDKGVTLEEYISYLKKNTSPTDALTIKTADGNEFAVYYVSCRAGDEIKVPVQAVNTDGTTAYTYVISGTNEGGVIVTVSK